MSPSARLLRISLCTIAITLACFVWIHRLERRVERYLRAYDNVIACDRGFFGLAVQIDYAWGGGVRLVGRLASLKALDYAEGRIRALSLDVPVRIDALIDGEHETRVIR